MESWCLSKVFTPVVRDQCGQLLLQGTFDGLLLFGKEGQPSISTRHDRKHASQYLQGMGKQDLKCGGAPFFGFVD
eukprot:225551-Amphidinium_carterae.2